MYSSEEDDCFLWKIGNDPPPKTTFSNSLMWAHLFDNLPEVPWHKSVWFKGRIPKHAFLTWLVTLDRLSTRDRMRRWGVSISPLCPLCNSENEIRQHLFFECGFSKEVWEAFCSAFHLSPPPLFMDVLDWIKAPSHDNNVNVMFKLVFQAVIYLLWKERNSRVHNLSSRPAASIILEIKRILSAKMDILSRAQRNVASSVTYLSTWRVVFPSR